jgi:hypothetical protein
MTEIVLKYFNKFDNKGNYELVKDVKLKTDDTVVNFHHHEDTYVWECIMLTNTLTDKQDIHIYIFFKQKHVSDEQYNKELARGIEELSKTRINSSMPI